VARAETEEALLRVPGPCERQAPHRPLGRARQLGRRRVEDELRALVAVQPHRQRRRGPVVELEREPQRVARRHRRIGVGDADRVAELLVRHDALRPLDPLVGDRAVADAHGDRAREPPPGPAHRERKRRERDVDRERSPLQAHGR